jgi:hypothetical protein
MMTQIKIGDKTLELADGLNVEVDVETIRVTATPAVLPAPVFGPPYPWWTQPYPVYPAPIYQPVPAYPAAPWQRWPTITCGPPNSSGSMPGSMMLTLNSPGLS